MKAWYNPFGNGGWNEGRLLYLVPAFIFAVFLGFVLELITIERLNLLLQLPLYQYHGESRNDFKMTTADGNIFINSKPIPTQHPDKTSSHRLNINESLWEKPILFNISDFHWIRNNESICQVEKSHPDDNILPILVHTARPHFSERLTIRKTWGSLIRFKHWSIRFVFLIGEAERGLNPSRNADKLHDEERRLDEEQATFGDIVQGSFIDSYKNLTYKHIMGYKWVLNFCTNAQFIMKVDDDIFVDIMRFLNWRINDLKPHRFFKSKSPVPDLYCSTFVGTKPQRCVGCKWFISEQEWSLDYYPDYCSGWTYGITFQLLQKLYSVADHVPFFWIDDVFVTGVMMEQLKKENPGYEPVYKHLWGQVKPLDFRNFRPMCERHDIRMRRKFGAVVPIPRGSNFERDMMCLWNKTLYDDIQEHTY